MLFLSYSREDSKRVSELAHHLKEDGWQVWMDVQSIAGGDEWRDQIAQGISEAKALVLNVSPSACSSDYVRKEVFFAIRQKKPIIPIMISDSKAVELPYALELELGHLHFLRWPDDGVQRIIDAVHGREKSVGRPAEDESLKTVQELLGSTIPALVSLGKDFIAYRRLVQADPEMALLRAVRIAGRGLTYIGQGLSLGAEESTPASPETVLGHVKESGLLSASNADAVGKLLQIGKSISLDELLSPSIAAEEEISADEAAAHINPLNALLEAVLSIAKNPRQASEITTKLEVVKGSDASRELLQQAFLVGQRTFGESVMPDFSGMERMHAANPNIYNLLVESSTGICIGYTSVVPVDVEALEATLSKDFDHIPSQDILTMDFPGFYFAHLSSIAVDPAYRDLAQAYSILTNAVLEDLLALAKKDIYLVGMSADAITANGHRICKSLGMTPVVKREGESTLFYGSLFPPKVRLSSKVGIELLKVYRKAFEEIGDACPQPTLSLP